VLNDEGISVDNFSNFDNRNSALKGGKSGFDSEPVQSESLEVVSAIEIVGIEAFDFFDDVLADLSNARWSSTEERRSNFLQFLCVSSSQILQIVLLHNCKKKEEKE
jgi:hypothetical protein